jgi:DNA-binding transcriptional ArsR family regulator
LEFKAQLISVLTRFWEQFYQKEYDSNVPLMVRSVEYHRRQTYIGDLATIFAAITGRRFPYEKMAHADVEKVIFYPSCHIGPYVYFGSCPDPEHVLRLHYNCRPTGTPEHEPTTPTTQDLFPPLKALADETRLQILSLLDGRELYAQEIVDQLDISQSAVSRHLKLMVTGGLLTVRKEDSMKFFSINTGTLAAAADRLKSFRGKTP